MIVTAVLLVTKQLSQDLFETSLGWLLFSSIVCFVLGSLPIWPELVVGGDGIRFRRRGRRCFVPWEQVARVPPVENAKVPAVRVFLTSGRELTFTVSDADEVIAFIRTNLEASRQEASSLPEFAVIESAEQWLEQAKGLTSPPEYRARGYSEDSLVQVAEDPRARPTERVAAAIALSQSPAAIKHRVRVGIDNTADPDVAEALSEALSGNLTADRLKAGVASY